MTVKTITVTVDAYDTVKRMKHDNESFSELFLRIGGRKLLVTDLLGLLKDDVHAESWRNKVIASRKLLNEDMNRRAANVRTRFKRAD